MVAFPLERWNERVRNLWWLKQGSHLQLPLASAAVKPFFIVSAGRSGTTLLRKKLVNSDQIHIPPESDDFIPYNAIAFVRNNAKGWVQLTDDILENFQQQPFFKYWRTDIRGLRAVLGSLPPEGRSYANLINLLYLHACREKKPDIRFWGDKTPYLAYRLEWLRKIFPGARYIHLVRDGRAVVHSMMQKQHYSLEKAAVRWRDSIHLFGKHRRLVSPASVLEIKYEDFVSSPHATVSTVCGFIGAEYDPRMMTDRDIELGDDVLPHHDNLSKPITRDPIDKWRGEMRPADIEVVNRKLQRELLMLHYDV